ncbi:histidine kinase dimerization/phosphoacceptor domain -containing protein [Oceanispirochaeta sp. M1]|uniref:histidine kinase dimerization/phosphoacceptor domain -containing protein n=1 Tax=Oceanispirochaeta sp. M1 TaxID=2283433 RepID=UPI0014952F29|nr:histidine kinase dimerization/phosphoacceptor domain -containing protein [Oceanispirochaeta sp. M1]
MLNIITSGLTLSLAFLFFFSRGKPIFKTATILMFLFWLWLISELMEYFAPVFEIKIFFNTLQYFATGFLPVIWLSFCYQIRHNKSIFDKKVNRLMFLYPIIVIGLVLSNPIHHLLWLNIEHFTGDYGLTKELQPLFDILIVFMFFSIFLGIGMLVYKPTRTLLQRGRGRWVIVFMGLFTISVSFIEWLVDYRHHFELTPLTLTFVGFSALLYIQNSIKTQILLNKYNVLATLKEPLFLIRDNGMILFANDSAIRMSGIAETQFYGINIKSLIPPLSHMKEGVIFHNHSFFSVNINAVEIENDSLLTLSLTEVTALKDSEISLKHLSDELETQIKNRTERLNQSNLKLEKLVEEKNILLQEVHHRVNNNLQMIISLLNLQGSRTEVNELKNYLKEAVSRVQTIAMVHQMLYKSEDFSRINLKYYLQDLLKSILKEDTDNLEMDFTDIICSTNTCIQVGMIMNEIILNALKYAYNIEDENKKFFCMSRVEKQKGVTDLLHIEFRDYGKGIDLELEDAKNESLGFKIINTLVEQRNGELKIYNDNGCVYELWVEL